MFGMHPELIILVVVAVLLIFGPKKLPEMGSSIGKSIKEFRKGVKEIQHPETDEQDSPEATSKRLDEIERDIASKKAALKATQPE